MTDLLKAVQTQEPGSDLVELIELEFSDSTTLYFHSGIGTDGVTELQFRDKTTPYTARTYTAIPIELKGVDKLSEGAASRPTLTVANVLATFRTAIGNVSNKDLIGKRVVRRQTLKKYLADDGSGYAGAGDASPPIEFPTDKFIIDRIASENKISISFELASVMDLEGVVLPNRIVVGKYCNWQYQGAGAPTWKGGCRWGKNSKVRIGTTLYKAYFNVDNEPILLYSDVTTNIGTLWSSVTEYGPDNWVYTVPAVGFKDYWRSNATTTNSEPTNSNENWQRVRTYTAWTSSSYTYKTVISGVEDPNFLHQYVESGDTIWRLIKNSTNNTPETGSEYWVRGDLCGKVLDSCKCRFQFQPEEDNSETFASYQKDTSKTLPFGGFPGSEKYR